MTFEYKVKSLVYGQALADAVGAYTEFRTRLTLKNDFPTPSDFTFPPNADITLRMNNFKRDSDSLWTDDTNQLVLIMDMLTQNDGKVDECDFAKRLYDWAIHGFIDLGQTRGEGIGGSTFWVISQPGYTTDPVAIASIRSTAANGSLMRTSIMGMRPSLIEAECVKDAIRICKTTHTDVRVIASCAIVTAIIYRLLHNNGYEEEALADKCVSEYSHLACEYKDELEEHCRVNSLDELDLDSTHMGYVLKCLGVAVWTTRQTHRTWKDVILEIILQGGDADTNAAVAGAILGLYHGFNNLPKNWLVNLKHKDWLQIKIDNYIKIVM